MKEKEQTQIEQKIQIEYNAPFPLIKAHEGDAGWDITSNEDVVIFGHERRLIGTELYIAIPEGYVGQIWSRSGLSLKYGVEAGAGIVDAPYRGEVKVLLFNHGSEPFVIKRGDRIAQFLFLPISGSPVALVETLGVTLRGDKGFGSSGV